MSRFFEEQDRREDEYADGYAHGALVAAGVERQDETIGNRSPEFKSGFSDGWRAHFTHKTDRSQR